MSEQCGVRRYKNGQWETLDDTVSREEAFSVEWSGPKSLSGSLSGEARLWAWPGPDRAALRELALGHVLLDCLPAELAHRVRGTVDDRPDGFRVQVDFARVPDPIPTPELAPDAVLARMEAFMVEPGRWDGTGCFHRAGLWLSQAEGETLHTVEDIGRHNCLDRLAGYACRLNLPLRGQWLFVTARVTASLYSKARRMGVGGIVSRSAVSLYALEAARRDNVQLLGFCRPRENRFTVYA